MLCLYFFFYFCSDSDEGPWLAEPEVCLSVGSMENLNSEKLSKEEDPPATTPTEHSANPQQHQPSNNDSEASPSLDSSSTPLPHHQTPEEDLEEQLSQHISNVAMSLSTGADSSSKEIFNQRPPSYKMSDDSTCYQPAAPSGTQQQQQPQQQQQNESFGSYQCNNNQSGYLKNNNVNSNHSLITNPGFGMYHHTDGRATAGENDRYSFLMHQHYSHQNSSGSNHVNNGSFNQENHSGRSSYAPAAAAAVNQTPNVSVPSAVRYSQQQQQQQHESPLDLQHQQQQAEMYNRFDLNHCR